jgi:DNA-binding transcriptional ArsR family regulator
MSAKQQQAIETRIAKAFAHPLRFRILQLLNERESSPSRLAEELEEPLGNVSYHVKTLLEADAIELVRKRQVRGAVEHVYRATARPYFDDADYAKLPPSFRDEMLGSTLQELWGHVLQAGRSGGLDDPETHISWTALDLDRRGYEEVVSILGDALERALEIQAEAAGRLATRSEGERVSERTELAILHYHRPRDVERAQES